MLQFTDHPMVDVGVAVILDHFETEHPAVLTDSQLKAFAEYLERAYQTPYFASYLSVLFTQNSAYINPTMKEENRRQELDKVLYGYLDKQAENPYSCVFCGKPARFRAFRQHIPLITGVGMINFFPSRRVGVEICPYCLLAIQAFPLGSLKVAGRTFFVHADDVELIRKFARKFKQRNEQNLLLQDVKGGIDGKYAKTLFWDQLLEVQKDRRRPASHLAGSITVYHLTNYGTNADIEMYHLPSQVVTLIEELQTASYLPTWNQMVRDGWRVIPSGKKKQMDEEEPNAFFHKNELYEDLFGLPENFRDFIRKHILVGMEKRVNQSRKGEPITDELRYWEVTERIVGGVAQVNLDRVEQTRKLADKIVDYLKASNDHRFYRQFFNGSDRNSHRSEYEHFRNLIIKTNDKVIREAKKSGKAPELPFTFDDFIQVFEQWDETGSDWRLGRDLVLLRVMERLYKENWFYQNPEAIHNVDSEQREELV